ncbi:PepSY domain-containing protein [Streptomyces sp. NBC_00388]|uniref:PepSY domain-containing protein n=1 Tax=Streptomyces sp. NBC_00388 TaxID=2975735 RepID=UPI002E20A645
MKRNHVIACVAAAALAAAGTATGVAIADGGGSGPGAARAGSTATTKAAPAPARPARTDAASGGEVTVDRVVRSARASVPGTVTSAELDHGSWEVDLYGKDGAWHELRLDRQSGRVVSSRQDRGDQDDRKGAPVTAVRAASAARATIPGTVTSVELDNGRWESDVTARDGSRHEVRIDLNTGRVTSDHLHRHQHEDDGDGGDDD